MTVGRIGAGQGAFENLEEFNLIGAQPVERRQWEAAVERLGRVGLWTLE